jgi:monoamine oxidase
VIVVGAGVAGLAALEMLDRAGLRVLLLEARDRIGGRIYTLHDPLSSLPLELGAEFVHGRPRELWSIIQQARLAVYDGTDESRYVNQGAVERTASAWEQVDSVMDDMRAAANGPDKSFEEFLSNAAYSDEKKQAARGFIEGFNAANSGLISIQALTEETAAADEIEGGLIFRFTGGYDAVPLHLLSGVPRFERKLRLNTAVERVEWKSGSVTVHARNVLSGRSEIFASRKIVVTVPLGVLQAGAIVFSPEPAETLRAARSLQFGQVFRVVLRFREAFWERKEEFKDAGFILSSEDVFPTWWTTLALRSTLLTGWSAGAHADELLGLSREKILGRAITSLARITGFPEETIYGQLAAMYFHDWHGDVYARGAYSYVPAGQMWARQQMAAPVRDTLYFAGEATDQEGHAATVHGAISSGRRAAHQILDSVVMAGG